MRLGGWRRARAREATPAPTDPYDRALSDLVDELRLHHPLVGDLRNFIRSPSKSSRQAANWLLARVMVRRDVRRDNESRERMSAASPAHGVCSGMDEVGGSQRCARAARGHP